MLQEGLGVSPKSKHPLMPFGNDVGRVCEVQPMSDYEIVMVII